jgi:hypothetical protein
MPVHVSNAIAISQARQNHISPLQIFKKISGIFPEVLNRSFSGLFQIPFLTFLLTCITNINASSNSVPGAPLNRHCIFRDTLLDSSSVRTYNGRTTFHIKKDNERKKNILQLDFDDRTYTTAEIMFKPGKHLDFRKNRADAFIRFSIKGKFGGERFFIGVADDDRSLNKRTEVKYYNSGYHDITDKWQEVIFPLKGFTSEGECWLEKEKVNEYSRIDWSKISSVRFSTEKEMNYGRSTDRIATIFIDDLEIVTDQAIEPPQRRFTPGRIQPEIISGPADTSYDSSNVFSPGLIPGLRQKTSVYTYGILRLFQFLILSMTWCSCY